MKRDFQTFVLLFTAAYLLIFGGWFLYVGNQEYLWYVGLIFLFGGIGWKYLRDTGMPVGYLAALSIAGFLHMAGRSILVGDHILYEHVIGGIYVGPDVQAVIFKYDQLLHAYGYGVGALMVRHVVRYFAPNAPVSGVIAVSILASMGIGAGNEIAEFIATLNLSHTYVGDYYNTGLDLVANASGAIIAIAGAHWYERLKRGRS